ncbi:chemotaxis protein CheC [Methanofollis formosanus]|uniref:Chemotaxis protein CheC n=1 Tax=Methanofollis formosanus TaxID=299308 RepID=A0A8G1A3U1_9EURY|nr:chemotaxis protein CheC [Methanofollis formosanus]QYZ80243.1 chemotaxis protein CheC [Methanofollis formosanus]
MKLTEIQADALGELGNIGAAHAATTLSQMLMSDIEMDVPSVDIIDIAQFYQCVGDEKVALVVFRIDGGVEGEGFVVMMMPLPSAMRMTNTMLGMDDMDREINEMDQSAIIEIGNIMVSAFLDATATLLGIVMLPSPPALCIDMAHAGMEALIAEVAMETNDVVIFRTNLTCGQHAIDGTILMFLTPEMLGNLLSLLEALTSQGM